METKLKYNVELPPKEEKDKGLKAKTKLSMQSTVMGALASTQPGGGAPAPAPAPQQGGWGSTR